MFETGVEAFFCSGLVSCDGVVCSTWSKYLLFNGIYVLILKW